MPFQQVTVTPDNRGPLINVASWLCLGVSSGMVIIKILMKWLKVRRLQGDDYLTLGGLVSILITNSKSTANRFVVLCRRVHCYDKCSNISRPRPKNASVTFRRRQ